MWYEHRILSIKTYKNVLWNILRWISIYLFLLLLSYNPKSIETIQKKKSLHIFIIEMLEKPFLCHYYVCTYTQRDDISKWLK